MKTVTLATILAASTALAPAQTIAQTERRQQQRIAQGIESGSLTPGETRSLEKSEQGINQQVKADRLADGGKLSATDRSTIQGEQRSLSNQIYQDKHNGKFTNFGNSEIGQRQRNQQDRIAQGIASGSLKPGQAAHLEGQEMRINKEVRQDRAANGGHLTPAEHAQVNRQLNREGGRIYRAKH